MRGSPPSSSSRKPSAAFVDTRADEPRRTRFAGMARIGFSPAVTQVAPRSGYSRMLPEMADSDVSFQADACLASGAAT